MRDDLIIVRMIVHHRYPRRWRRSSVSGSIIVYIVTVLFPKNTGRKKKVALGLDLVDLYDILYIYIYIHGLSFKRLQCRV